MTARRVLLAVIAAPVVGWVAHMVCLVVEDFGDWWRDELMRKARA